MINNAPILHPTAAAKCREYRYFKKIISVSAGKHKLKKWIVRVKGGAMALARAEISAAVVFAEKAFFKSKT